ncbi:MAG: acyltransferase [Tessaracoccus sp.]
MSRLVTLDGIRGIAAAVVVVHHYLLLSPWIADAYLAPSPAELSGYDVAQRAILILLWQGPFAVAIFFVLSGLVLSRSLFSRRTNWPRFLSSRLARLYLPVVGAVAIAAVLAMAIPRRPAPGMSWWTLKHTDPVNWSSVINNLTLFRVDWLNSPLWTLQCEVAFSLLLPVYILLVRVARRVPWLLGTVFVVIIVMGALTTNGVALYMPLFGLGVLAAALPPDTLQKLREWRARRKAMGIIIALVVANIGWFSLWPEDRLSTALLRATTALGALALVIIASVAVGDSGSLSTLPLAGHPFLQPLPDPRADPGLVAVLGSEQSGTAPRRLRRCDSAAHRGVLSPRRETEPPSRAVDRTAQAQEGTSSDHYHHSTGSMSTGKRSTTDCGLPSACVRGHPRGGLRLIRRHRELQPDHQRRDGGGYGGDEECRLHAIDERSLHHLSEHRITGSEVEGRFGRFEDLRAHRLGDRERVG